MKKHLIAALSVAGLALSAVSANADEALDRIFDDGQLASIEAGTTLEYGYTRKSPHDDKMPDIEAGGMEVAISDASEAGKRGAVVRISDGKRERELSDFSGDAGNPMIVVFLESVATTVSRATGGSPFYIKNRIKDAFRAGAEVESATAEFAGDEVESTRITYAPFANETQKERLGVFVDLALTFTLSDELPGGILSLAAESAGGAESSGGYAEIISFEKAAEAAE